MKKLIFHSESEFKFLKNSVSVWNLLDLLPDFLSGSYPKNLRTNPDFEVTLQTNTLIWKTNHFMASLKFVTKMFQDWRDSLVHDRFFFQCILSYHKEMQTCMEIICCVIWFCALTLQQNRTQQNSLRVGMWRALYFMAQIHSATAMKKKYMLTADGQTLNSPFQTITLFFMLLFPTCLNNSFLVTFFPLSWSNG